MALVLGAGGFVGGAWLTGALQALQDVTDMQPRQADLLVGTSAGAMIAALTAAGVPAAQIPALFNGDSTEQLRSDAVNITRPRGAEFRWHGGWPRPTLGSGRLAWRALRHPGQVPAGVAMAAALPRGFLSTEPIKEMVRRSHPEGWPGGGNLWLIVCDVETGERVAIGRDDVSTIDLADAVAASCAIPGFYHPVSIKGRTYVDGGCWSTSNLDMLERANIDLVFCFNPTSSLEPVNGWPQRVRAAYRTMSGRRLGREAALLRAAGSTVALIQPVTEDLLVMGANYMRANSLDRVTEVARQTVARQLRTVHADALAILDGRGQAAPAGPLKLVTRAVAKVRPKAARPSPSAQSA